jgi:hypothetical protein
MGFLVVYLDPPGKYGLFEVLGEPGVGVQSGEKIMVSAGTYYVNPDPKSLETKGAGPCWSVEVKPNQTSTCRFKVVDSEVDSESADSGQSQDNNSVGDAAFDPEEIDPELVKAQIESEASISREESERFLRNWLRLCEEGEYDKADAQLHRTARNFSAGFGIDAPKAFGQALRGKSWSIEFRKEEQDPRYGRLFHFGLTINGKDSNQDFYILKESGRLWVYVVD